MRKILMITAAGLMLGGLGFVASPASAAVSGPTPAVAGASAVETVQMTRRERMMQRRMMRHRMRPHRMMRSRMQSDLNSANPSRPGYMQRKGNTSGGPRY